MGGAGGGGGGAGSAEGELRFRYVLGLGVGGSGLGFRISLGGFEVPNLSCVFCAEDLSSSTGS